MPNIENDWKQWLDHNLSQGCDPIELYRIMRSHSFDINTIKEMMGDAYIEDIDEPVSKSTIDYLSLSEIMESQSPVVNAKRIKTNLLQLYTIDDFLNTEQCKHLITVTEENLLPSKVSHSNGDQAFRTSKTCHLNKHNHPFVDEVNNKIAKTLGINISYSEPIQAQRYKTGEEFKPHHDYFSPNLDIYKKFTDKMGQRTWTFMIYLNNTPKGGGTHFSHLDYTFYPQQGQAVLWNNLSPDGKPNRHTLHHGMPVKTGEKFIITKWFREKGSGNMFMNK